MLTLDINKAVVDHATEQKTDLIISHHPFFFDNLKSIDYSTYDGEIIKLLILNNINLYSMHTNFDMATRGINEQLARMLNLNNNVILHKVDDSGYGGLGIIDKINIIEFAKNVKEILGCEAVKLYTDDANKIITRVAYCGGSGADFIDDAICLGADIYVTGDIKYHQAQTALKNNLSIIDAGHYYTEHHFIDILSDILKQKANLDIITYKKNTVEEIII